ncbi:D-2-hydroxyacid dehydrogenase family protein [Pseudonocardia sp. N23]|uniref:D-2-hydroxyacid dehydrogenase family protein n=1 Tax=Pseudonocardia sp. N23 TaxID=1987376 RepID=UPI001C0F2AD3|nr:D-2-hydroxyacid dehydrogenase family protein [Pseudonocardia sp. N23]
MRCAVLDDYQGVALTSADWTGLDATVDVFGDHLADEDALVARLAGYDTVVLMRERTPFPRNVLEKLPDLRLLVTTGMRNASVDMATAAERGVTVCGTGGVATSTPELTWALITGLARHLVAENTGLRGNAPWQQTIGVDLAGATLGVLGLGRIGSRVAKVGLAFGCDVLAWSQNLTADAADAAGVRLAASKAELVSAADFLTIHLVLSDRSRGLVGADEIALMKPTAYLVNTSRAPIVDQDALVAALRDGRIAGAGLDVFDVEPLPADHPYRTLPNVLATPHLGYVTRDGYAIFWREVVEDIAAFAAGTPVRVIT